MRAPLPLLLLLRRAVMAKPAKATPSNHTGAGRGTASRFKLPSACNTRSLVPTVLPSTALACAVPAGAGGGGGGPAAPAGAAGGGAGGGAPERAAAAGGGPAPTPAGGR